MDPTRRGDIAEASVLTGAWMRRAIAYRPKPPASGETNPGGTTAPAGNGINYSFPAVSTHSKTNRPSLASTPASR
ncbi:hypothetical protein AG1IA_09542 [Rhizoctonia solani AG-1 IA]|uniref:Uncharacterized protein n=1 Tax=Thanatephorus cucumeris (strain AG1-IA) TaxID=983506 RepID=L8WI05_THACA|nr:hypothetical protein AG1IA_09542 [Rhizoctonia solani AG-1 IA]